MLACQHHPPFQRLDLALLPKISHKLPLVLELNARLTQFVGLTDYTLEHHVGKQFPQKQKPRDWYPAALPKSLVVRLTWTVC